MEEHYVLSCPKDQNLIKKRQGDIVVLEVQLQMQDIGNEITHPEGVIDMNVVAMTITIIDHQEGN